MEMGSALKTLTNSRPETCRAAESLMLPSAAVVASFGTPLLPRTILADVASEGFHGALRAVRPLIMEDIAPIHVEFPEVRYQENPSARQPSINVDHDLELICLLSAPEVPSLADLLEVDWLDSIGPVRPRLVPPQEAVTLEDPSRVTISADLSVPAFTRRQPASLIVEEFELDPIPLPLKIESVPWLPKQDTSRATFMVRESRSR